MRPWWLVLSFAAIAAPMLVAQQQEPVFRSHSEVVTIQVAVRSGGKPVARLTAADFQLRDNGVAQEIRSVSAEQVPIDLTLLLDLSGSVDGQTLQRLKSAVADTAGELGGGDRVRLIAVSEVLREVFDFRSPHEPLPLDTLNAGGATSLYDGLAAAMMRPSDPGRRQLVVAFTDGRDSTSIVDEPLARDIARRTDALVDIVVPVEAGRSIGPTAGPAAAASDASSMAGQAVGMAGRGFTVMSRTPPDPSGPVLAALGDLTLPTAGQVLPLERGGSISGVFKRLLNDFRASYLLQYIPKGVAAGGWHEVGVVVSKPGKYDVRARKGYVG